MLAFGIIVHQIARQSLNHKIINQIYKTNTIKRMATEALKVKQGNFRRVVPMNNNIENQNNSLSKEQDPLIKTQEQPIEIKNFAKTAQNHIEEVGNTQGNENGNVRQPFAEDKDFYYYYGEEMYEGGQPNADERNRNNRFNDTDMDNLQRKRNENAPHSYQYDKIDLLYSVF